MKQLRALQNTPYCTGTKSYARLSHEEVCAPIYPRTYKCKYFIYINMCYNVLFFWQAVKDGTPPTRAQSYIKTHTRNDGNYPNDIVKERCVCYSPFIYCFTYMCDYLFTMHISLTHQHLIQHAGEDGDANANQLCRIVKHNTRNSALET
jgi:hypothetical protein